MKRFLLIFTLSTIIFGCQEGQDLADLAPEEIYEPTLIANDDITALATRVKSINSGGISMASSAAGISFTQVAEVTPNQINGLNLSATGVTVLKGKAYVTYHVRGENYGGEILAFDVSNPNSPQLLKSLVDEHADYNDIMMGQYKGNIWVAGARDIDVSKYSNSNGAIATKIGLANGLPKDKPSWEVPLLSYSASSITRVNAPKGASNGRTFITSGSKGGIAVVRGNNENEVFHNRQVNNAKHFDYGKDKGVFLRGNGDGTSTIDIYALDDSFQFESFTIPYDVTPLGKNGIDVFGDNAYLAMGEDGLVKVDLVNKTVVGSFQSSGVGLANAVQVDNGLVYVANGSDGLIVLEENSLALEASYKFSGSCNYVHVDGDNLFISNGSTGGLIIMAKD